ncbi:hypothetical protein GCM10028801_15760 [Nocardioides maradonensis]
MSTQTDTTTVSRIRTMLLELARSEEALAADELAATPYWSSTPATVVGHRDAAAALRSAADLLIAG